MAFGKKKKVPDKPRPTHCIKCGHPFASVKKIAKLLNERRRHCGYHGCNWCSDCVAMVTRNGR